VIERGGVIGAVLDCWMISPDWKKGVPDNPKPPLSDLVKHIDHICQLTGNTKHVGIGSDLDGGFGTEQCPEGLDTISDLQKLAPLLDERGYSEADIDAVFHGNWLRFFRENLPQ
jgi:membrane dipeptidase